LKYFEEDGDYYLEDLVEASEKTPAEVKREVNDLVKIGIVEKDEVGDLEEVSDLVKIGIVEKDEVMEG